MWLCIVSVYGFVEFIDFCFCFTNTRRNFSDNLSHLLFEGQIRKLISSISVCSTMPKMTEVGIFEEIDMYFNYTVLELCSQLPEYQSWSWQHFSQYTNFHRRFLSSFSHWWQIGRKVLSHLPFKKKKSLYSLTFNWLFEMYNSKLLLCLLNMFSWCCRVLGPFSIVQH